MQNPIVDKMPLVSVIMSAYNEEKYIVEAVNSILNQTYRNIELIVVDDASSDGTVEKIKEIEDKRIRLHINSENKKLAHNLNLAIDMAKGKYVARMDADDIAMMNRIEEQVCFMEKNKEIDVLGAFAICFGDSIAKMEYPKSHEAIKVSLLFENALCHPLVMFRKSSLDEKYNESYIASQDYELWSRLVWKKKFYNMEKVLLRYRVHKGQTRNIVGRKQKEGAIVARHEMLKHLIENPNLDFVETFDQMFLVGKRFDQETIDKIEVVLKKIIEENKAKRVYDQDLLYIKCAQIYFENWYYCKETFIQKIRNIKQCDFLNYYYHSLSIARKIKVKMHCLL